MNPDNYPVVKRPKSKPYVTFSDFLVGVGAGIVILDYVTLFILIIIKYIIPLIK